MLVIDLIATSPNLVATRVSNFVTEDVFGNSSLTLLFPDVPKSDLPDTTLAMHESPDGSMYWVAGQEGILLRVGASSIIMVVTFGAVRSNDSAFFPFISLIYSDQNMHMLSNFAKRATYYIHTAVFYSRSDAMETSTILSQSERFDEIVCMRYRTMALGVQVDVAESMTTSTTVMDLSGGIFYSSFEEVMTITKSFTPSLPIIKLYATYYTLSG